MTTEMPTSPLSSPAGYPRVAARSDLYEIVGILRDGRFSIFIDDAVTNEPVSDATLQVTVGDATGRRSQANG